MAGDLNIALILRLVDQVSGPAKSANAALKGIGSTTEKVGARGVAWADKQLANNEARRNALRSEALGIAATGFALYQALKPAVQFESAMAGVSKVLDFDKPDGLKLLGDDILKLTTEGGLPMAAEGIAEIIEAAGQAGVVDSALPDDEERKQLLAFATDAAKMGVAFDISAGQAGQAMAQWRKAMELSKSEALGLGDAINHLSNNMNATAPGLVEVIRQQGAVAMSAGLAETEVAALAAAMLSGGARPEVAATGMKNFLNALTKGEAMTGRQSGVMKKLGIDAVELSKRMQVDAKGGILEVVEALSQLPEHAQNASIGLLFGEESKGAIMPLLKNMDLLREAFGLIADETQYAGAMQEEYLKQSATTANALKLTTNYVRGFAISVGSILLPELNALLAEIQPLISAATAWAAAHPELITGAVRLAGSLFALKIASIGLRWGFLTLSPPFLHLFRAMSWIVMILPRLLGGFGLVRRAINLLALPLRLVAGTMWLSGKAVLGLGRMLIWLAFSPLQAGKALLWFALWPLRKVILGMKLATLASMRFGRALIRFATSPAQWGRALLWLAKSPIKIVIAALRLLSVATMSNPIALLIGAIIGLGYVLYANWGAIVSWFKGKISEVAAAFDGGLLNGVLKLLAEFNPFTLIYEGAEGLFTYITGWTFGDIFSAITDSKPFQVVMEAALKFFTYVTGWDFSAVIALIKTKFAELDLYQTGVDIIQSLWDGAVLKVAEMVADIKAKLTGIMPAWVNGGGGTDVGGGGAGGSELSIKDGRDSGGPVRAGMPYIVGERARELFIPGVSGSIVPTRALKAAMAVGAMALPAAAQTTQAELTQRIDQRPAIGAPSQAPQIHRQGDTYQITVNAASGMDERQLVKMMMRQLKRIDGDRRGDLHDGVNY